MNYSSAAMLLGLAMLASSAAMLSQAPRCEPVAGVSLELVEASLRHATLNALAGYLKRGEALERLRENLESLDLRLTPIARYAVLSLLPEERDKPWSEAMLEVEYTLNVGGELRTYRCRASLLAEASAEQAAGRRAIKVLVRDEEGPVPPDELRFAPEPMLVQLDASGIHLLLHYPDWCAPETVAVTDARGITIYVNASQLGGG